MGKEGKTTLKTAAQAKEWPLHIRTAAGICMKSSTPMLVWWGNEPYIVCNKAASKILNDGREIEPGTSGSHALSEFWKLTGNAITKCLVDGNIYNQKISLRHSSNEKYLLQHIPIENENGIIAGVFTIINSSEENHKHSELNTPEEAEILDHFMQAPVGICILKGEDFKVDLINQPMLRLWEREQEVIGNPVIKVLPAIEGKGFVEILEKVYRTGIPDETPETGVLIHVDGNKTLIYVDFLYQPYYENRKITGVLVVAIEVTARVLARKQIEDVEERARLAIDSADLGVFEINLLNEEMITSPRFASIYGVTHPGNRKDFISVLHPDDIKVREDALNEALITGDLRYEARVVKKDGSLRWIKVVGKLFKSKDDKPVRLLGIAQDITLPKQLERQKDDFIAIASHELKTPVTTFKAYGQILQSYFEDGREPKVSRILEKMDGQVNRLSKLISDLLDVTKMHSGKLEFEEDFYDFNELLLETIEDLENTAITHEIKQQLDKSIEIYGDKDRIGQVLNNLIGNAIKYSPDATSILITTKVSDGYLNVSVIDYGIGIEPENIEKVFQQFYRISGSEELTFPGLGLGLYISSEIIKRQGGKIWVESEPGKGSTFHISLPADHRNMIQQWVN